MKSLTINAVGLEERRGFRGEVEGVAMRIAYVLAGAPIAALAASGAAFAEAHEDKCFDKGALSYVDCPKAPEPVAAPEPVMQMIDESGWYVGVKGGAAWLQQNEFFGSGIGLDFESDYDLGFSVAGQVGYEWDDAIATGVDLRLDVEAGYLSAEVDTSQIPGLAGLAGAKVSADGDTSVFSIMANAYADFNLTDDFELFAGGGLGVGFTDFDGHIRSGAGATVPYADETDAVFGFHLDAGAAYDLTDHLILEASYRYSHFVDADAGVNGGDDIQAHQALLGLRYKF